ncbi:PAS domain-containing protein [Kiloniella antarctica]|uniref:PAS domain-containing protein n=1 Tax=Kiloniella antarctica TaxID=1550907 RepID=A0ABW5BLB5_9PROT
MLLKQFTSYDKHVDMWFIDCAKALKGRVLIEIKNARNRQFFDYWQSLERKGGSVMPLKSSFVPEEVGHLLSHMIVYELISKDNIKIRLQGTAINERFGQDITGGNYLDYVEPERRDVASNAFWLMAEQPCGIIATLEHALSSGRKITVESIGFPFENDRGENPIIMYQSNEIEAYNPIMYKNDGQLKLIFVVERHIIDIGKGAPSFVD